LGAEGLRILRASDAAVGTSVPSVVRAVAGLIRLHEFRQTGPSARVPLNPVEGIAAHDDRDITEVQAKTLLRALQLPTLRFAAVATVDEAVGAADSLSYPVVVKVISPDIPHKSEVGGVQLDLRDPGAVRAACAAIEAGVRRHAHDARVEGYLVE